VLVAGTQLANLVAHRDATWPAESLGVHGDRQPAVGERDPDRRARNCIGNESPLSRSVSRG
jgi:hypothetical protein